MKKNKIIMLVVLIMFILSISVYNIAFAKDNSKKNSESDLEVTDKVEEALVGDSISGWTVEKTYKFKTRKKVDGKNIDERKKVLTKAGNLSIKKIVKLLNKNPWMQLYDYERIYCLKYGNYLSAEKAGFKVFYPDPKSTKTGTLKTIKTTYKDWGGTNKTNVFAYAVAFSQKKDSSNRGTSNYYKERAQKAIWSETNKKYSDATETTVTTEKKPYGPTNLWRAANALDVFYKTYNSQNSNNRYSKVKTGNVKGTTLVTKEVGGRKKQYYKVGPFQMNDYVYAYSKYVKDYSGSGISNNPKLIGGIIDMKVVLTDENDGSSRSYSINNSQKIKDGANFQISYESKGNDAVSGAYTKNPTNKYYKYPRRNSKFYIYIDRDIAGNAANVKLETKYRKTVTASSGWVVEYSKSEKAYQPLLVVKNSKVELKNITHTSNKVRLTTNITIDKYITKVVSSDGNTVKYNGVDARQDKPTSTKHDNPVEVSKGDTIIFKVVLKNNQNVNAKVSASDIISEKDGKILKIKMGSKNLELAKDTDKYKGKKIINAIIHSDKSPKFVIPKNGSITMLVSVKVTRNNGIGKNTARIITRNKGDKGIQENSIDYCRLSSNDRTVVNVAPLNGKEQSAVDYFKISSEYETSVNKRIVSVEHADGTKTFNNNSGRSTISESDKSGNPVYVEYGDRVTYKIDIENKSTDDSVIFAKIKDQLPIGYSDLRISVNNGSGKYIQKVKTSDVLESATEIPEETYADTDEYTEVELEDNGSAESTDGDVLDVDSDGFDDADDDTGVDDSSTDDDGDGEGTDEGVAIVVEDSEVTEDDESDVIEDTEDFESAGLQEAIIDYSDEGENASETDIVDDDDDTAVDDDDDDEFSPDDDNDINEDDDPEIGVTTTPTIIDESVANHIFKMEELKIKKGEKTTITVSFVVEGRDINNLYRNTARITEIYKYTKENNIKQKVPLNNVSTENESSDYYKINNYKASINKYVSSYSDTKTVSNNNGKFTIESNDLDSIALRKDLNETEKLNYPLAVEKGEEVIYSIVVKNEAVETANSHAGATKKATKVRPSKIRDTLKNGLRLKKSGSTYQVTAEIYDSAGNKKGTAINPTVNGPLVEAGSNVGKQTTYTYDIGNDRILEPGDYIVYYVTVEIIESNMYLDSIENKASIQSLTNINHKKRSNSDLRYIKNDTVDMNISDKKSSAEYVRMKDLVIAGRVWFDKNKNGLIDEVDKFNESIDVETNPSRNIASEKAMKNIVVRLYQKDPDTGAVSNIRTVKTNSNGFYSFAYSEGTNGSMYKNGTYSITKAGGNIVALDSAQRIPKATNKDANKQTYNSSSKLYEYYVEYEYDGLIYKSTEIYADNQNITATTGAINDNYKIDSNAAEFKSDREEFNKKYEIAGYNYAAEGTNTNKLPLEYQKSEHASYLKYSNDENRKIIARSFINKDSNAGKDDTNAKLAGTKLLWLYKQTTNYQYPETEYLKYINLGLSQREKVDVSVVQDVYEVRNIINGEEMTYWYNQNSHAKDGSSVDHDTTYTAAFSTKHYMTGYSSDNSPLTPYTFKYYLSDYNYKVDNYSTNAVKNYKTKDSELNSEISFRIKVTNNINSNDEPNLSEDKKDVKVYTGINEVIEYFDEDFMNIEYNADGSVKTINIKTKNAEGYLQNTELKIADAYFVKPDGTEIPATMVGKYNRSNDKLVLASSSLYNSARTITGYNTVYIRPNTNGINKVMLAEGENVDIIIKFIVGKSNRDSNTPSERNIKTGLKTAIAEIGAYSTYYDAAGTKPAGLIDTNSNPSNFGDVFDGTGFDASKNNKSNDPYLKFYEDDNYKTGINLELQNDNERRIEGEVWDDTRSTSVLNSDAKTPSDGIQYIGNGRNETHKTEKRRLAENARKNKALGDRENYDFLINDVGVKLVELVRMPGDKSKGESDEKIYEETIVVNPDNKTIMETRTGEGSVDEGEYLLKGYIPGEYVVKFFYGDKNSEQMLIFNGQDYKSTVYQKDDDGNSRYAENAADTDEALEILEAEGGSDAKDDEVRRLEVISYSETLNNNSTNILRGKDSINPEAQINNTNMKAETADFLVRAEKERKDKTVLTYQETINKFTASKRHPIENIDFGLQYRPEQQIVLNKYVKNVKIITSDNNSENAEPLVDAKFNEYYGVVASTDFETGVTTFVTYKDENGEDVILRVKKDASKADIISAMRAHGINYGGGKYLVNGKYQVIVAGTELDTENSIGISNLQYVPNSKDSHASDSIQGFVYLNIDDQIMQGAEIKIEYLFTGHNISEIDRVSNNLSLLRFKNNETVKGYTDLGNSTLTNQYSGAMTARNSLYAKYYKTDTDGVVYRQKQYTIGTSTDDYYGSYLGLAYYDNVLGSNDVVSELKFDKILDYADNNLVFKQDENNSKEGTWIKTTTQELLNQQYIDPSIPVDGHLVDKNKVAYDTLEKSNLALLQDFRTSDTNNNIANADVTKYLLPRNSEAKNSFGIVKFLVSKVISAEDDTKDMNFENIGEILEYSSVTGRVTNLATTIGDVNLSTQAEYEAGKGKSDTGAVEEVTLTPPTGLYKRSKVYKAVVKGAGYGGITIAIAVITIFGTLGGIKIYRKRRIK